ncbi:T9SS type A sorting domain-containing protein [Chryseobacterium sp. ISL-6]|uniref:T9SS type A sorting domain-containing protein n=1 Tax=Chryseobacterium sp. ISL-6 TaxID=2819143 RepID=UPI00333E0827
MVELNNLIPATSNKTKTNSFNFYPNPVQDNFTISSEKIIKSLLIYDISGKLIISKTSID